MIESDDRGRGRPSRTTLCATALWILGLALCSLSWWFLLLVACGAFGPGVLRELGWLHDKDEFQRVADYRAGYHAYLAAGIVVRKIGVATATASELRLVLHEQGLGGRGLLNADEAPLVAAEAPPERV